MLSYVETKKLIKLIKTFYPERYKNYTESDYQDLLDTLQIVFADYTVEQISTAIYIFVRQDTKGFAPSVGQLIEIITKVSTPKSNNLSVDEAWSKVVKAVQNSAYNSIQEFEALPEACKRVVVSANNLRIWGDLSVDEFQTVIKSHFYRSYQADAVKQKEELKIPATVRNLLVAENK